MTDLLERLRRDDPTALEELGHELLPFVQAAMLAQGFVVRDPPAVLQLFRDEVALCTRSSDAAGFFQAVVGQLRARAASIPVISPDASQQRALAALARLEPLPMPDREMVIARFVERLPAELTCRQFGLEPAALALVLARGADLLAGPDPTGTGWLQKPSLLDPNADPAPQFVELENTLTCLAIDVTALEREPVMAAVPVLKQGFVPQAPQEHYPSKIETQGSVDLPAEAKFVTGPAGDQTASGPTPIKARGFFEREDATEPQGVPITVPPSAPQHEATELRGKPLLAMQPETTAALGTPLFVPSDTTAAQGTPLAELAGPTQTQARPAAAEETEIRGKPLADPDSTVPRARPLAETEPVAAVTRPLPFHRKVSPQWWWSGAALCAVLGISLYWGFVSFSHANSRRPWEMVSVVTVARDLPEGTRISLDLLSIRQVPVMNVTSSVVKPDAVEYALGQRLEFPLQAGDPLLWSQFDVSRRNKRFDIVKRGRAFAIPILEQRSLGGQLVPKEEVDLVMIATPQTLGTPKAITILQKVRVLAVGGVTTLNMGHAPQHFTDVTFLLVPEEVEMLTLARHSGPISLTLRNTEDPDSIPRGETTIGTLLSGIRLKALERKRGAVISAIRDRPR